MSALRSILSPIVNGMSPDGTIMRIRLRTTLDMVLTMGITVFAVALTIGYHVSGRRGRNSAPEIDRPR